MACFEPLCGGFLSCAPWIKLDVLLRDNMSQNYHVIPLTSHASESVTIPPPSWTSAAQIRVFTSDAEARSNIIKHQKRLASYSIAIH